MCCTPPDIFETSPPDPGYPGSLDTEPAAALLNSSNKLFRLQSNPDFSWCRRASNGTDRRDRSDHVRVQACSLACSRTSGLGHPGTEMHGCAAPPTRP